jgi:hypothetical protein
MITDEQLNKFIKIYEEKYGQVSRQEALDEAIRLVRFVRITCFGAVPKSMKEIIDTKKGIHRNRLMLQIPLPVKTQCRWVLF